MPRYNPAVIEPKWQQYWEQHKTFATPDMPTGEKVYILDMFPYPSGAGLHVGHVENYTATDIVARMLRLKGVNVLQADGSARWVDRGSFKKLPATWTPPVTSWTATVFPFEGITVQAFPTLLDQYNGTMAAIWELFDREAGAKPSNRFSEFPQ